MKNKKFIIYQMLLRVFGNRSKSQVSQGSLVLNGTGKFSAVTNEVFMHLKGLGVTHIWYTGVIEHATCEDFTVYGIPLDNPLVVKGLAGSPYAIKDYYDVNPYLADNPSARLGEFVSLVERTHKAGFGVIIDFVPNHVARGYHQDSKEARIILAQQGKPFPPDFGDENYYLLPDRFSCRNFIDSVPEEQKKLFSRYYAQRRDNFAVHLSEKLDASNRPDASDMSDASETSDELKNEYLFDENPAKATGNNCFNAAPGAGDWYETVKLNYGVGYSGIGVTGNCFSPIPDTWLKMREILLFWLGLGVDGFRCDMAEMVPVEFWEWVTKEVKCRYPSAMFIAEIYNRHIYETYLFKGGFDYLYDKEGVYDNLKSISQTYSVTGYKGSGYTDEQCVHEPYTQDGSVVSFLPQGRLQNIKASAITYCWQGINDIQNRMLNFLENHDEQRIASDFNLSNSFAAIPELVVSLMLNKAPFMLYFGQEVGERGMLEEGYSGKDGRTSIFDWCFAPAVSRLLEGELFGSEKRLLNLYRTLLGFAMGSPAVTAGDMYDLSYCQGALLGFDKDSQFVFARVSRLDISNHIAPKEVVIVAVDFKMRGVYEVYIPKHFVDYASLKDDGSYSVEWLVAVDEGVVRKGSSIKDTICLRADSVIRMRQFGYGVAAAKFSL